MATRPKPTTGRAADMTDAEWDAFCARKDAGRAAAHAGQMKAATALQQHPEMIDAFRVFAARMHPYSIGNALRIFGQDPSATRADARFFWGGNDRRIREDAAPVWIYAPKVERTRKEEVTDPKTGQTETVEEHYSTWPVEDVYPASATVPKNGPCIFCGTDEGGTCPPGCAVMQPVAGPIPSRDDVVEVLHKTLKAVGGFDASGLDELDDPFPDGATAPGLTWHTLSVVRPAAKGKGKKDKTRRYRFLHEADLETGRIRYAVAGFGVIWIGPDTYAYGGSDPDTLRVEYGDVRPTSDYRIKNGSMPAPYAPVVYGITLGGYAIVSPEKRTEDSRFWLNVWRVGPYHQGVPDATRDHTAQVVRQLIDHYLTCPERADVEAAHARLHAPKRAAEHADKAAKLRAEMEDLQAKLAAEEAAAAAQSALIGGQQ
ncbi:hypothetical protein GCM10010466_39260 [Planomonospora alba]|uniref:Uncharacterized protein n=1 Tax=Planomonospora alba TaxID=161354 RepID=A0ABP6NDD9_9ACTN